MDQLVERSPGFIFEKRRRQIEGDSLVEELHDLLFFRALDLMFLFVLEIVLNRMAQFSQRFLRHDLRRKRVVQRGKDLLLYLVERYRVISLLPGKLRHREFRRELYLNAAGISWI